MDEALVSSTQRLRIERSNLRLPLDIQSKESTLQLVYDVLRRCPFFKAFLVTADVPEFCMQELWATAYVHQQSIRFKINNKKLIEILDFIKFLGHSATIRTLTDININKLYQPWRSFAAIINKCQTGKSYGYDNFVYQVEHKNHKMSNEMYYHRFTKVIIHHFMSKDPSILKRNKINLHYVRDDSIFSTIKVVSRYQNTQQYGAMLPIELMNDEIRNTKAYKEYYAFATGEAAPKPKASARKKKSGSDTSITPPIATTTPKTTVAVTPKLIAAAKGKQPAKAKSLSDPSEVARTEAQQLKIVLRRSRQQMHISQPGGLGTNDGTGSKPRVPDVPNDESEEELSWNSSDDVGADDQEKVSDDDEEDKDGDERDDDDEDQEVAKFDDKDDTKKIDDDDEEGSSDEEDDNEETRDNESFDPIPQTPKSSEDEGDGEEDQSLKISKEERLNEEEEADELYGDVDINQGRGLQVIQEVKDSHVTLTSINSDGQQESSLKSLEASFSEYKQTNPFAEAVSNILSIVYQHINQQMTEASVNAQLEAEVLTRSSHSSRTSYAVAADLLEMELKKILIEKMEGNKGDVMMMMIRMKDPLLDQTGGLRDREKASASESAFVEEPVQTTSQIEEPLHPVFETAVQGSTQTWISKLAKQADSRSSFNELLDTPLDFSNFIMNRLRVDTLTPELLAEPTFELIKGSCTSLIELEYHLEEVYKATTDQLDWVNPEGQQYPHNLLQPLLLIPDNRGNFKRLRLQDIEDMLLLLVQGKLTNLTIEERFAFNVSLRIFTRSIIIQRRVEDLQLGVESYQKRLNFTKPDTYRSDLKRREAYTAYSNPRGFIYQNKDKKNRLMRIDELHKFSDGTLNDVHTSLDDRLKGIMMHYLPQTIWRKGDKDRATAMIQAIDKMLKTRRIMRSLEKFVRGRLYEGDFRMLQRTI
nr:hypothetical protein [Tanacetum cinerariifolium]